MLEVDVAGFDLELRRIRHVGDEARFVENAGHFGGVAEDLVQAREHGIDHVEAHGEVVGVSEHHHERAGADAEPRVAAAVKIETMDMMTTMSDEVMMPRLMVARMLRESARMASREASVKRERS